MNSKKFPRIAIVLGTRPEIVKLAPVIRECVRRKVPFFILHTGQHYSPEMDSVFFRDLSLPDPAYNLAVGSGSHGAQTGRMLEKIEEVFLKEMPGVVVVQGDTNSGLAGALAAVKLHIPVAHVEAGLRSYFRAMPEEVNRVLVDQIADFLFVPTKETKRIAQGEGISSKKIVVTGNTIVDLLRQEELKIKKSTLLSQLGFQPKRYFFLTLHRPETVDSPERFRTVLESLAALAAKYPVPIVWPLHPRTRAKLVEFELATFLETIPTFRCTEPLLLHDCLALEKQAQLILTDSGGLQEEACTFGVPCVTLRDNTERPETVAVGANTLVGIESKKLLTGVRRMLAAKTSWRNPLGDGHAAEKIVDSLLTGWHTVLHE